MLSNRNVNCDSAIDTHVDNLPRYRREIYGSDIWGIRDFDMFLSLFSMIYRIGYEYIKNLLKVKLFL